MRKSLLMLLVSVLCFSLCSCASSSTTPRESSTSETNSKVEEDIEEPDNKLEVVGDPSKGMLAEISVESDSFVDKLVSFGFTESEAVENANLLKQCGIPSIELCEPTDPNATVDGLVSYRGKLDDDRTVWFTVESRKIFYISLNGEDLYDEDKGGYLKNFDDVHIPETYVSNTTKIELRDLTETVLDKYFLSDTRYYDAWAVGREDNIYMVQCQISDGSILTDSWIYGYVWYEQQPDGEFKPTGVKIDGKHYEVKY